MTARDTTPAWTTDEQALIGVASRVAVYWTPEPSHPLWQAGCTWLGRDPTHASGHGRPRDGAREPFRYGFHATLKAPFRLRDAAAARTLLGKLETLARRMPPFAMPRLRVAALGGFVALRPAAPLSGAHPLRILADACVRELDDLRAPDGEGELRRRAGGAALSVRQRSALERWGYPFVFDDWRLHLTLSDAWPDDAAGVQRRKRLLAEAADYFSDALAPPLACASICLFIEPGPGQALWLARRFPLG